MPAILYTNASPLAGAMVAPASRPKSNRPRTIYNMHSSRNGHKLYSQSPRSRPLVPFVSPTVVSSSTSVTSTTSQPTPSVLSPASSSISFFPPYASQVPSSHPQPPSQSRSSSQSSIQTLSSVSSMSSTSSISSQTTSAKTTSSPRKSGTSTSSSRATKGVTITDAYRRRYASYLASTFNMSMEAALIEADYQLLPQTTSKDCGISEAEVYRSD